MKKILQKRLIKIVKWVVIVLILFKVTFYLLGRLDMKNTIKRNSGIEISYFFKVMENKTFHYPGAFDSDYTWVFKLKVSEKDIKKISEQIENSKFYNAKDDYSNSIYDSLTTYNLKGYWVLDKNVYEFYQAVEQWKEITTIQIDRLERTIEVNLTHL
ncbi:hypothetical protein LVD17_07450 [Fulvivirga ulvae]|uniref:hypothetical protein n=1 Tax=Fulvivirga ulvae TaxID=2904245 RepID=UPI001F1DCEB5|nr:hypothetical protein [Fulvivirga ulvae]UII33654.1 hypothetical protein LVD17_07450 [Fulvivirga ulvae]